MLLHARAIAALVFALCFIIPTRAQDLDSSSDRNLVSRQEGVANGSFRPERPYFGRSFRAMPIRAVDLSTTFIAAIVAAFSVVNAGPQPTVTIDKPRARTTTGGVCRLTSAGTFGGTWGPRALPTLAFTIGPGSAMADQMHANKAKYTGPGSYKNEIIAVYVGKTALQDSYIGLGTVIINADGHSGKFTLNDGSAAGRFDCGATPNP